MLQIIIEPLVPSPEASAPLQRSFDRPVVTVGRKPENDIVLPSPQISGHHLEVRLRNASEIVICDLGSSNGTFIEDRRIEPQQQHVLKTGERVIIGSFLLTILAQKQVQASATVEAEIPPARIVTPATVNGSSESLLKKPVAVEETSIPSASQKPQPDPAPRVALEEEYAIKARIHDLLIERLDLRRKEITALSDADLRSRAQEVVESILVDLRWELPVGLTREALIKQVLDEALGLGPLEELLADDSVSEIMVNRFDQIYAERHGKLSLTAYRFSGEGAVLSAIERIIAPIGRRIDESSPLVDARLKDGSRVNAVIRPLALRGPCITIRKFAKDPLTIDDLVRFGSVSQGMADFLQLAVKHRLNIVISGGTGSGKTTLLNVISSFIPEGERVVTVEDAAELKLPQEHIVAFETRPPNLEGKGAITIRDLVKNALRMRPDRIIVGECRGAEALDMLQAMNTGHDGSMTTGHANSPDDMIRRLETMVLTSGIDLPMRAVREQLGSAVHMIVQQTRFSCGTRKVTAISEVLGIDYDEGTVQLQEIFAYRQTGYDANGKIEGYHQASGYIPRFFRKLQERGLPVNASVFSPED